ncbi:MAG: beta strand repeat-containing protein [Janthinobacterium lividum]
MKNQLRSLLTSQLLLVLLLLLGLRAQAQTPAWQTAVAAAGTATVQATATDGSNIYLVGGFSGTATFGSTSITTANAQELFVAKYSLATSSFLWVMQGTSTGTGSNIANAVAVSGGYVFVAGNFTTTTVKLGTLATLTNASSTAGTSDLFVARLTDAGSSATVDWSRRAGGTGNDYANALSYTSNFLYVGGSNGSSAGFGTYTLANAGGFVALYYYTSTLLSAPVPVGGTVTALTASYPTVYAAGSFSSTANTFVDATHPLTSAGSDDAFVARLSTVFISNYTLAFNWAQRAGGTGGDYARAVQVSGSSVYVAGASASASTTYGSTTLTNAGSGAAFVAKLTDTSTAGTFAWAVQNGGGTNVFNSFYGLGVYGTSVYVAGSFGGAASFGSTTLTSAGNSDVVLAKLTDAGNSATFTWAQQAGGAGLDYAYGLVRVGTQVYTVGQVATPATFGSLSIGTASGARPGFLASVIDPAPLLLLAAPNAGTVGSTTTLYGTGLTGTTAITFAGTSNNVVTSGFVVNAAGTQITGVVVPSGAQSGTLNVTTLQGTSNGLVNYTVLSAANVPPAWQSVNVAASYSYISWAQPDASGNVVVAGSFSGTLTLGGTTLTSAGGTDLFVAKYNPGINAYVWAQRAGSTLNDSVYGLVVNGSSLYVAGTFDGQTAVFSNTTLTGTGGFETGYVAKLTDAGNSASFTWAQLVDDGSDCFVESLAVSGNSVYIGGDYTGTTLTIGSGSLSGNVSGDDGFIAKLTDNGSTASFVWAKAITGPNTANYGTINVYGIVVRGSTVYLSGIFYGTVNFGNYTLTNAGGEGDVAVARLTDAGTTAAFTAALAAGGTGQEFVLNMVGQGTALYLSGQSFSATWPGSSATSGGSNNAFVCKVTDTGTSLALSWLQLLGGAGGSASQLAVNGTGVYVAGNFYGPGTFGSATLLGAGGSDGFVARLADASTSSSVSWVQTSGGLAGDGNNAVALTPGKVYAGGFATPLAAFGAQVLTSPANTSVATLATIADATVLATTPAALAGSLGLYPNPAHGTATVQLPAGGTAGLSLLDVLGREVRSYPATTGTEATLDLHGLPAGLYVLRTGSGSGQKLVVE